jgi:hypothetical protein
MRTIFNRAALVIAVIAITVISAAAQVTGGAVTGSVVDQNGAIVRGATVVLKDKARGQEFTTQTTDSGSFQFPNVSTGSYALTVNATGFAASNRELVVSLNQTTTVDVALAVSGGTSIVDVVAGSEAVVQTDSSQIGTTFKGRAAQDLPINGNANNLALLAPNVVPPANGTAGSGGASGGIRSRANSFNIDGVDNNDASVTGPSTGPIQDAVSEFTLLQNNFNAEFGAGAGGQFNTITKSGTNDYHGSLFTYVGSQKLNARSTNEDGSDKNYNKEVRYGFTAGGPIPYPHFGEGGPRWHSGKNKLFFFFAYEKYFQESAGSESDAITSPTLAGLNQIAAIPGVSPFIVNLFMNSVSLAPTQTTTRTVLGVPGIPFGTFNLPVPSFQAQKSYQFNVDHLPNEKNQFRYRYARTRYSAEQEGNGGLNFNNFSLYDTDLFSVNWIRSFSSSVVNDLRLSYLRTIQDFPLKDATLTDFPNLKVNDISLSVGPNGNLPQGGYDNNYQLYDSITWVTGAHTLKFGGDVRRYIGGSDFLPRSRGDYAYTTFDRLIQDLSPDVVYIRGVGQGTFVSNNHRFFGFAQDDWKIRPNLTLNLGIRYEYQGLYRDAALQATAAPANIPGVIEFGVPEVDKNNWAPRIGIAWAPNWDNTIGRLLFGEQGESSIRANYSRAFFPNFSNFALISLPPTLQSEVNLLGTPTVNNFLATGGIQAAFVPNLNPTVLRNRAGSYIQPQIVPYADSIAISYQRELGASMGLEIRYLKTWGKNLPVQVQLNSRTVVDSAMVVPTFLTLPSLSAIQALPTIQQIVAANPALNPTTFQASRQLESQGFLQALTGLPTPIGESRYDGLSVSFTRRFVKNLGFTAAYTWSKTRDNSTNELNTSALNPRRPADAGENFGEGLDISNEWGPSPIDIPHRFVASWGYDIPFFNNSSNAFLKAALGGWQVNGIFQVQSGQPITIQAARDVNRNGDAAGDRALFNPNGNPNIGSDVMGVTINAAGAIQLVALGSAPTNAIRAYVANNPDAGYIRTGFFASELADNSAGTAGRNTYRTKGFNNTDLVVLKNTRFGGEGRYNFQVGAEIFDLFNQRQVTIGPFTTNQGQGFATPGNVNFLNYNLVSFSGRTITMRAKFIF